MPPHININPLIYEGHPASVFLVASSLWDLRAFKEVYQVIFQLNLHFLVLQGDT